MDNVLSIIVHKAKMALSKASTMLPCDRQHLQAVLQAHEKAQFSAPVEYNSDKYKSLKHLTAVEVWDLVVASTTRRTTPEHLHTAPEYRYNTVSACVALLEAVRPSSGRYLRRVTEDNGFLYGSNSRECIKEMSTDSNRKKNSECTQENTADTINSYTQTLCLSLNQKESITRAAVLNHLGRECIVPLMPVSQCTKKQFEKIIRRLCGHPLYQQVLNTYAHTYCNSRKTEVTLFDDDDATNSVVLDLRQEEDSLTTSCKLLPLSETGYIPFIDAVYLTLLE
jgi:hypothetical protein